MVCFVLQHSWREKEEGRSPQTRASKRKATATDTKSWCRDDNSEDSSARSCNKTSTKSDDETSGNNNMSSWVAEATSATSQVPVVASQVGSRGTADSRDE